MKEKNRQRFLSAVRIGPKGQIVIPKEVRDIFGLAPGDTLVLMADKRRGIALQTSEVMRRMVDQVFDGQNILPEAEETEQRAFAKLVEETVKGSGG